MGKILQQMLGFLLISVLLAFSESFPHIYDRNLRSGNKKENLMIEDIINEVRNNVDDTKEDDINEDSKAFGIIGAKLEHRKTFNVEKKVFRTIRGFTFKTIGNILKYHLKNKRKYSKMFTDNTHVILGNRDTNKKMQTNFTTIMSVVALAKPMSVSNFTDVDKKSDKTFSVDTIKMPMPAKSKVDRWLPGLRNYRRRRSFFSDLGFGLESAFDNDDTEVVFGAHTSPCDYLDRHYCLNGGTCVFLGALEVKTCRCKIGYTGLRCEMINQEFLLALLSEEFFG